MMYANIPVHVWPTWSCGNWNKMFLLRFRFYHLKMPAVSSKCNLYTRQNIRQLRLRNKDPWNIVDITTAKPKPSISSSPVFILSSWIDIFNSLPWWSDSPRVDYKSIKIKGYELVGMCSMTLKTRENYLNSQFAWVKHPISANCTVFETCMHHYYHILSKMGIPVRSTCYFVS